MVCKYCGLCRLMTKFLWVFFFSVQQNEINKNKVILIFMLGILAKEFSLGKVVYFVFLMGLCLFEFLYLEMVYSFLKRKCLMLFVLFSSPAIMVWLSISSGNAFFKNVKNIFNCSLQ